MLWCLQCEGRNEEKGRAREVGDRCKIQKGLAAWKGEQSNVIY